MSTAQTALEPCRLKRRNAHACAGPNTAAGSSEQTTRVASNCRRQARRQAQQNTDANDARGDHDHTNHDLGTQWSVEGNMTTQTRSRIDQRYSTNQQLDHDQSGGVTIDKGGRTNHCQDQKTEAWQDYWREGGCVGGDLQERRWGMRRRRRSRQ